MHICTRIHWISQKNGVVYPKRCFDLGTEHFIYLWKSARVKGGEKEESRPQRRYRTSNKISPKNQRSRPSRLTTMRAFTTLALIASLATLIAAAPVPNPPPGVQAGTAAYVQGQPHPLSITSISLLPVAYEAPLSASTNVSLKPLKLSSVSLTGKPLACLDYFADSGATVDTEPLNKRHPISVEACYDSLADDTAGHVEAAQFRR